MTRYVARLDAAIAEFRRTSCQDFKFSKIRLDQEFERSTVLRDWAASPGLEVEGAANEGHEKQGAIDSCNRVIRMFYTRIHAVNPNVPVVVRAKPAVEANKSCFGAKIATALELWFNTVPEFSALLRRDAEISIPPDISTSHINPSRGVSTVLGRENRSLRAHHHRWLGRICASIATVIEPGTALCGFWTSIALRFSSDTGIRCQARCRQMTYLLSSAVCSVPKRCAQLVRC